VAWLPCDNTSNLRGCVGFMDLLEELLPWEVYDDSHEQAAAEAEHEAIAATKSGPPEPRLATDYVGPRCASCGCAAGSIGYPCFLGACACPPSASPVTPVVDETMRRNEAADAGHGGSLLVSGSAEHAATGSAPRGVSAVSTTSTANEPKQAVAATIKKKKKKKKKKKAHRGRLWVCCEPGCPGYVSARKGAQRRSCARSRWGLLTECIRLARRELREARAQCAHSGAPVHVQGVRLCQRRPRSAQPSHAAAHWSCSRHLHV
jgi:hypothetical protein